jgi:hypothetical protein
MRIIRYHARYRAYFHHHRWPANWLVRVGKDQLCGPPFIPTVSQINSMINTLHYAPARAMHQCAAPPPTHPPTLSLYRFKDSLVHPDPYSEALRHPLRGSAHCMGPQAFSMASGHSHLVRLQKNRISHPGSLDARPIGCTHCSKGSAHVPTTWAGVLECLEQRGVVLKKDIRHSRSDIRYRMWTYGVNVNYDVVRPTNDVVCQTYDIVRKERYLRCRIRYEPTM